VSLIRLRDSHLTNSLLLTRDEAIDGIDGRYGEQGWQATKRATLEAVDQLLLSALG
jgi:hypothetical protein